MARQDKGEGEDERGGLKPGHGGQEITRGRKT